MKTDVLRLMWKSLLEPYPSRLVALFHLVDGETESVPLAVAGLLPGRLPPLYGTRPPGECFDLTLTQVGTEIGGRSMRPAWVVVSGWAFLGQSSWNSLSQVPVRGDKASTSGAGCAH